MEDMKPLSNVQMVLTIVFLALFMRLDGLGFGLPDVFHQDEAMMVNHALKIGSGDWNTGYFVIPQLISYVLFLAYGVFYLIGHVLGYFRSTESFGLSFFQDPTPFYLIGRSIIGVVPGTLNILALYLLGKRHFSIETGFASSLLLAVAPIHVAHSHYIYADILVTLAITLLFHSLLSLVDRPSWKNYLFIGLWLGVGTAIKYTALYFVPVIILTQLVANHREWYKIVVSGITSFCVFATLAPYTFFDWENFYSQVMTQSGGEIFVGWTHHLVYSLVGGTSIFVILVAIVGVVCGLIGHPKKAVILLSGMVWFYLVNALFSQHFARYALPIVPFVCLFAAVAVTSKVSDRLFMVRESN